MGTSSYNKQRHREGGRAVRSPLFSPFLGRVGGLCFWFCFVACLGGWEDHAFSSFVFIALAGWVGFASCFRFFDVFHMHPPWLLHFQDFLEVPMNHFPW